MWSSLIDGRGLGHLIPFAHRIALFCIACSLYYDDTAIVFRGTGGYSSIGLTSILYKYIFISSGHPENLFSFASTLLVILILSLCAAIPVFVIFKPRSFPSFVNPTSMLARSGFPGFVLAAGMIRNLFLFFIFHSSSNLFMAAMALSLVSLINCCLGEG